jgi:methylisocitrate lyase
MTLQDLREEIQSDELLVVPGVFDALTARIVESIGFDAVYLGGYATGASIGATEPMTTLTEMCQKTEQISRATELPLIVDGGAGFGNPAHTYRSIREFINSGAAGVHIEDQVYPKRLHYFQGIKRIIGTEEMVEKIQAADQARREADDGLVLIARTDAARGQRREEHGESIEDAVTRLNEYLAAGADVGMAFPTDEDELEYAVDNVEGPFMGLIAENRNPRPTTDTLAKMGCDIIIYGLTPTFISAQKIRETYTNLLENGTTGLSKEEATRTRDYIESIIGLEKYYSIEEKSGNK